ncbi:MAG: hypothetical protein HN531_13740 [Opitutae bacterium]|jgi:hypothetical protein|nr:hypothetical protein [Opitutae bacterium]
MKKTTSFLFVILAFLFCLHPTVFGDQIAGYSGAVTITVPATRTESGVTTNASATTPIYKIISAGVSGEPVFSGFISSVGSNTITFENSTDGDGNVFNPFVTGAFKSTVKVPILTAVLSGNRVDSITIDEAGAGFNDTCSTGNAQLIDIDYPQADDNQSTYTATVSGGKITGLTPTNKGSGYATAPSVTVVGGPHFVRLTEKGSPDVGRYFLITDNTANQLTLDVSKLATKSKSNPTGETLAKVLQTDYSVEIVPAATVGGILGNSKASAEANGFSTGLISSSDFVYLWNASEFRYDPHFFLGSDVGTYKAGWYNVNNIGAGHATDQILYPDESFIVANRTSNDIELTIEGAVGTTNQKMYLPAYPQQALMNNPFGADVILGEIIPADYMGTEVYDFRPSASDGNTTNADTIFFLSGSSWNEYYYKGGVNDAVTEVATASAKAGTHGSDNGIGDADVEFVSGTVSALASCDSTGGTSGDHNTSEYTKVSLSGVGPAGADDWNGFSITFSEISGRSVSDTYDTGNSAQYELDVNGSDVSVGSGIMIYSNLNGAHEVVDSASGYVIVKVKRDVNFDSGKGDKKWALGSVGAGYNTTAKAYFIGGNDNPGATDAIATVTVDSGGSITGFDFTGTGNSHGSKYTEAPQVIITGGGWRLIGGADAPEDDQVLSSDEGIIVVRKHPTGILTYVEAINPVQK